MPERVSARITPDPIDPDAVAAEVADDAHGAMVLFHGVVRDHDGGRSVDALEYEAHPDAERRLRETAHAVAATVPGVRISVVHRIGALVVGDTALVAAVSSPHRAEAFDACARLVDELKRTVPIWKRQRFGDGGSEWVGIGDHDT